MKRWIGAAAVAALLALSAQPAAAQELRGWNVHVPDYPGSVAMDHFARIVAERTQNRVRPKVFHSAQLGNQDVAIQQMQLGAIDFAVFNFIPLNNVVPETVAASLPFVFRSVAHLHKVMDGPIGADIGKAMEAKNMVALAYYDSGSRSFYNSRRPIRTPDDMKGMKIRVQASDMYVALMAALGANATPIPFGEVFTALQSGVVDGAENNWPSYESTRHYEVAKHYTLNEHTMTPEVFAVARTTWARISPADQAIVRAAAVESAQMQRKLWAEREVSSRKKVEAAGAMIVDNVDKGPWIAAMKPVYDRFGASAQVKPLLDRILAEK
jgi:tripartite ATP-independent transporter DctP family solute receptor